MRSGGGAPLRRPNPKALRPKLSGCRWAACAPTIARAGQGLGLVRLDRRVQTAVETGSGRQADSLLPQARLPGAGIDDLAVVQGLEIAENPGPKGRVSPYLGACRSQLARQKGSDNSDCASRTSRFSAIRTDPKPIRRAEPIRRAGSSPPGHAAPPPRVSPARSGVAC